MAVRKRQTAWDILTKLAPKTVRTRFETIESGSKQKQNERFAWDFLQNTASDPVRNKRMAVRKRQTAWDILTQIGVLMVRTRFETMGWRLENGKPRGTSPQKRLFLTVPTRFETMGRRFGNGKPRWTSAQKSLFLTVPRRLETIESIFKRFIAMFKKAKNLITPMGNFIPLT
jgi:hypothetical protein